MKNLIQNIKLELCGHKRRLKMRCLKDNNSMYDPALFFENKSSKELNFPVALGFECNRCKSRFIFMTKEHSDCGKGNEIQEFDKDNNITMYNGDGTLSENQTKHFMYLEGKN